MRQIHKLDFLILNLFFFSHFLYYISEMFSSISKLSESVLSKYVEN